MLITLYKIGELHFRLLGTNSFHVKAESERSTAASLRCRQNLKYENFTSSFGRLRQNIATKSVQHDYFSWTPVNRIHLFQKRLSERTANGSCRTEIVRPKGTVVFMFNMQKQFFAWR